MRFAIVVLLTALGLGIGGALGAEPPVRVLAPVSEVTLPLWVAEEKGFLADAGVSILVAESHDPTRMLDDLQNRRHEIAIVLLEDVLAFNGRHAQTGQQILPGYAIASITGGTQGFVLSRDVKSLGALRNRRIAVDAAGGGQAMLWATYLEGEGIAPGTYELVPMGEEQARFDALMSGKVDATMLLPAYADRAAAAAYTVLKPMSQMPFIGHVYAISSRWVQRDRALSSFVQACVQAMDWLHEPGNRAEAAALLRKRMPALTAQQAEGVVATLTATTSSNKLAAKPGFTPGCAFDNRQSNLMLRQMLLRESNSPPSHASTAIVWQHPQEAREAVARRAARDGWEGVYAVAEPLTDVLKPNANHAKAERAIDRALRSRERMADGTWVLQAMFQGFRTALSDGQETHEQRIAAWRAAYPESVHARLAEAWYWTERAWKARGNAAASQVPQQAFELMRSRLARAQAVLDEIGPRGSDHPIWHWASLHVAFAAGRDRFELNRIFAEAVGKEPTFVGHYTAFANSLTPRWGGSVESYRGFVDASVKRTQATEGKSMYAWLYPLLTHVEHDRDPFRDLEIPWQDLRAGFEDLLARHPSAKQQLHLFASWACRAEDRKTFQTLHPKLNQRSFPVSGAYTWDYCTEVLLQRS